MQYTVSLGKEKETALAWLENHGYEVKEYLKDGTYPYGTVIIDWGIVFGGNVTCFAAHVSNCGRVMTWQEWLNDKLAGKLYC